MILDKKGKCTSCKRNLHHKKCANCGGHIYSKQFTIGSCALIGALILLGFMWGMMLK